MKQWLHKISEVSRAGDWRLSFVPFVMGCVYLWLWWFNLPFNASTLFFTFLSLLTTIGFASLGYFINEFFDKESDAKAGKINKLAYLSPSIQGTLLAVCLLFTFVPWIWLPTTKLSWLLVAAQVFSFLIYSMPFPRFKEHAIFSIILDACYAYVLPLLLSFYTFSLIAPKTNFPVWFYPFAVAIFFVGLRNIIIHQVRDVFKDAKIRIKTLPMILGVAATKQTIVTIQLYEIFFWLIACVLLVTQKKVFLVYTSLHAMVVVWAILKSPLNAFDPQKDELLINRTYLYLFPVSILLLLTFKNPFWMAIFLLHLLLLFPFYIIEKLWLYSKQIYFAIVTFLNVEVRNLISKMVNYPIYYAFKIVGIDLIKENKSAADVLFGKRKKN